jgi:hypothetical protein
MVTNKETIETTASAVDSREGFSATFRSSKYWSLLVESFYFFIQKRIVRIMVGRFTFLGGYIVRRRIYQDTNTGRLNIGHFKVESRRRCFGSLQRDKSVSRRRNEQVSNQKSISSYEHIH